MFLTIFKHSAAYEVFRLHRSIALASARFRPHTDGRLEVSDLLKLGHLEPFLRMQGDILVPEK